MTVSTTSHSCSKCPECDVVLTVISNRELPRLNELVLGVDPQAFMVINHVNEVKGRGFTLGKK